MISSGSAEQRRAKAFTPACALIIACGLFTAPARAADPADRGAEALFKAGRALLDEGRTDEACPLFERSVKLEPTVGALVNLGRCRELQGKTATAWRHYVRAAKMASDAGDSERATAAKSYADKLEAELSHLTVRVSQDGLSVLLDGELLPREEWGRAQVVDPGEHRIEARGSGRAWSTRVNVGRAGDNKVVVVSAPSPTSSAAAPAVTAPSPANETESGSDWRRPTGIVLGAVGVASMATGAVFGVLVLRDVQKAKKDETLCPNGECTPEGEAAIDRARTKATIATLTIGLGAVAATGGAVLYFTAPREKPAGARLVPNAYRGGGGMTLVGRF